MPWFVPILYINAPVIVSKPNKQPMSCSKLYTHAAAFIPEGTANTPVIVFKASVHAKIMAQLAALAVPEEELSHKKTPTPATADYECGIPKEMKKYTASNGLHVLECIEENKKTGFAIIMCKASKKALVAFGRRAFSNWCEYPVDGCGRWNEARFKAACATVFLDDPNYEKVMLDIMLAASPEAAQKATKGIANFDPALWDSKAVKAMYGSLLLTCTNKEFFDMHLEVAGMIRTELGLDSLVGAVAFVENVSFDGLWGDKFSIRDFVDAVAAVEGGNLLDAAKEGFAGKAGKNQLGMVLTAVFHAVCEVGCYEEFKALVQAEKLVVVRDD